MQRLYSGKCRIVMHLVAHSLVFSILCVFMLTFFCMAADQPQHGLQDQQYTEDDPTFDIEEEEEEEEFIPATEAVPNSTVIPVSPQFVIRLPDKNLLCFSFEGYEHFSYNLITSSYLVLNGFLNLTSLRSKDSDQYNQTRGFSDIGVTVKAVDKRIKAGRRFFKHLVYGSRKKAIMEGFGEVDLNKGAITFSLMDGHSNIESQQSRHEKFRVMLDKPKTDILAVASNGHTFNIYVEDCSGLVRVDMHGLIGQFFHPKVRVRENYKTLHLADGRAVPVEKRVVWDAVVDEGYKGEMCWYPEEGESIIEGSPWEYIVEHIMSTSYKHSLFSPR